MCKRSECVMWAVSNFYGTCFFSFLLSRPFVLYNFRYKISMASYFSFIPFDEDALYFLFFFFFFSLSFFFGVYPSNDAFTAVHPNNGYKMCIYVCNNEKQKNVLISDYLLLENGIRRCWNSRTVHTHIHMLPEYKHAIWPHFNDTLSNGK